jgi:putative FmdB family regulatory protein
MSAGRSGVEALQKATGTLPPVPTYEYTCRDCGHTFEIVQSMTDEPLTMCPECGGSLRKVFAPPAISFKGSGFYATDHGKKSKRPEAGKTEKKDAVGEGAKDTKGSKTSGGSSEASKGGSSGAAAAKEPATS